MPYFRFPCPLGGSDFLNYDTDPLTADHDALQERFRKTLYYGTLPTTERPSLPLTDIAVELLQESAPRKLGKIDSYMAAATSRENCISPCAMMTGMIYVNRLRTKNPEYLKQISSSDLFLISMMMASKFLYDEGVEEEVFNDDWATSADLETDELNQMERKFLSAIDWNLFVGEKEFANMLHNLESSIALKQGIDRGWFTYTDLWVLSHDTKFLEISQELSKVILVSSLTYLSGILTMIGSTVLVTAATATIAPIILHSHSRLAPLPVTNLLPVTDQAIKKNVTMETDKKSILSADEETSFSQGSLDYVLTELMKVVSLPTSFVKFWYSAMYQVNSRTGPLRTDQNVKEQVTCSSGPCLPTANLNCQNISDQHTWESWDFCTNCQTCQEDQTQRLRYRHGGRILDGNDQCRRPTLDCTIKCCCKQRTGLTFTDTVAGTLFPDVLIGFNTGFLSPVYVTT